SPGARRVTLPRVVATTVGGRRSLLRVQGRAMPDTLLPPVLHHRLERRALRLVLAHVVLGGLPDLVPGQQVPATGGLRAGALRHRRGDPPDPGLAGAAGDPAGGAVLAVGVPGRGRGPVRRPAGPA